MTTHIIEDIFYQNLIPLLAQSRIMPEITHLHIEYIDRGIEDFEEFAAALHRVYPNLTSLKFTQNYSVGDCNCLCSPILYSQFLDFSIETN